MVTIEHANMETRMVSSENRINGCVNSQQTNDVQFVFISSSVIKFSACILKPEGKGIRCTFPCIPLCPVFFLPLDQNLKIFRGSMVHDMLIGLSTVEQLSSNKKHQTFRQQLISDPSTC